MICILKFGVGGQPWTGGADHIRGWIIAADVAEARRKADGAGDADLASQLYRMEFTPPAGRHNLPGGYLMLVD